MTQTNLNFCTLELRISIRYSAFLVHDHSPFFVLQSLGKYWHLTIFSWMWNSKWNSKKNYANLTKTTSVRRTLAPNNFRIFSTWLKDWIGLRQLADFLWKFTLPIMMIMDVGKFSDNLWMDSLVLKLWTRMIKGKFFSIDLSRVCSASRFIELIISGKGRLASIENWITVLVDVIHYPWCRSRLKSGD